MATSHKRETARRRPRAAFIAGPLAVLATGTAVTIGVLGSGAGDTLVAVDSGRAAAGLSGAAPSSPTGEPTEQAVRDDVVSRSSARQPLIRVSPVEQLLARDAVAKAVRNADTKRWTTEVLNLWTRPDSLAENVGEIDAAERVLVTGREHDDRVEIVVDGKARWVTSGFLADEEPLGSTAGLSMEPCPDGSVESGITPAAVKVYRAVCNAFPEITSYGGWDPHGEHTSGRAIDIMTSDVALGDAIAAFLLENAGELNLYDIIWRQQIWTQERSSEGWRGMEDRGSATANHYDHVHVAVY